MSLIAELQRRSVFKVGAAYLVVGWLVTQAAAIALPAFDAPAGFLRAFILLVLLGFPVALVLAWAFEITPEGVKVDAAGAGSKRIFVGAALLAALAVGWFLRGGTTAPGTDATQAVATARSIAVLPFVNMSGEAENEFFSDGLSEEILNSLAQIDGLQVVGRTSSFQFKGKDADLREVGTKLGVATVLEGSVRRSGEQARITAQLVRVSDGFHLWSETYDRTLADSFAIQHEIAEKVAGALNVLLDDRQRARMREAGVESVEAFVAYQRGRKVYDEAHDPRSGSELFATLERANLEFARAVALDPRFSQAYLASTDLYGHILLSERPVAERAAALTAARKALDLAVRSARNPEEQLYASIDRTLYSDDWSGLKALFDKAATVMGCSDANWSFTGIAYGYGPTVIAQHQRRVACNPLQLNTYVREAQAAIWTGQPALALEQAALGVATMGGGANLSGERIKALVMLGRLDEARAELAQVDLSVPNAGAAMLFVRAAAGDSPEAILQRTRAFDRGSWYPELWRFVDMTAYALAGDRVAANRVAVQVDAAPGGALRLATTLMLCECGVPFDLKLTPNLNARMAESGLAWPPRPPIRVGALADKKR